MWFRDDVRNLLIGVEMASAQAAQPYQDELLAQAYRSGHRAAIIATGATFGIFFNQRDLADIRPGRAVLPATYSEVR